MIGFFIGIFVGGFFGVAIMSCLNLASEVDDQMEREQENLCNSKAELVDDDRENEESREGEESDDENS